MASAAARAMALLVMAFIALSAVESTIPCSEVANKLVQCVGYAQNGGVLPAACCSGVKQLKAEAITTDDRQTVCNCIKSLAKQVSGLKQDLLETIPGKCGVDIGYPISFSVDCSKVK